MIQFNLLPDVKMQYVKARRTMHMVTLISFAVGAAALFVLLLLILTVDVAQRKSLNDLNGDIKKYSKQVRDVPNINKILTIQNQLSTLTSLHDQKVVTSRLFPYISQLTPNQASISKLSVDFTANTFTITGDAPTLDVVNTYIDTLKNTNYVLGDASSSAPTSQKPPKAFSQVVLSSFGRTEKGATYTITLNFEPLIFNSAKDVKLSVPAGTTGAQAALFQQEAKK
jgi:Tfp pilus assembly protein PilN